MAELNPVLLRYRGCAARCLTTADDSTVRVGSICPVGVG
jgi:hypothetical protein